MASSSATLYTARFLGPTVIEKATDSVVSCPVYRDGALVAPTSGTVTVFDDANVAVVSAAAVTMASSVATYTVLASAVSSKTPADGWRFEWALVLAGETHTFRTDGTLALRRLYPVVTDLDLLRHHPDLARIMPSTETSYQDYLDASWAEIESRLVGSGKRPWLILSSHALRNIHLFGTLALIYRDRATGGAGTFEWELAEKYSGLAAAEWDKLTLVTADASTGEADAAGRRRAAQPTLWLSSRGGAS